MDIPVLRIANKIPKEKNTMLKFPDINNKNQCCVDFVRVVLET